ncbi:M48 family metallopeptidase [Leeuwenhoekiella polynyae]|uniref:Zn-dependent protease with chaperone function n=1 Tax=Leeuwenhoekiella polynyae TaxID=1550906 RepID=A0A4Q0P0W4_9FLAO|nr:M48 family metallopeptidase [Leeuwenhoekiella polynyae]RXG20113.1 Zn-dependent protease with chaperone function [Leeuwenhoekiella polynyae]
MSTLIYPESPTSIPEKLTSLESSYKYRAALAVFGIFLFFILYLTMVAFLGYLVYYAFTYEIEHYNKWTILLKIGSIAGSIMLFLFTLKFMLKLKNHRPSNRILLKKEEHPDLWNFVDTICEETGAPRPKNIYVDPDVNAYVRYTNIWLSLFLPVKKELTIGLGLLDCLNLSEFKAVAAHEFGHFAQKSMKIGSYINSANTIIHNMIFDRDKWDDLLDRWRAADIRLSFAAWAITPVIWLIRQLLRLFYQFLNIMYSSLSREMEFNADKVAVKASGSDPIVSALWKLDDGSNAWNNTVNYAYIASQKGIAVDNLYEHSSQATKKILQQLEEKFSLLPLHPAGGKKFFDDNDSVVVGMYASHPSNQSREENAKSPYVSCVYDKRSPWLLFGDYRNLQQQMTCLIYKEYLKAKTKESISFEAFQQFIKEESSGTELLEAYHNTFENRYLHVSNIEDINSIEEVGVQDPLYFENLKDEVKALMQPVKKLDALLIEIVQIAQGEHKAKSFSYKDVTYSKKQMQEVYSLVVEDRNQLLNFSFIEWDKKFCYAYLCIALQVDAYDQLYKHYKQHEAISSVYKSFADGKTEILNALQQIQSNSSATEGDVRELSTTIKNFASALEFEVKKLDEVDFVKLPNIDSVQELKEAIIKPGELAVKPGNIFENDHFQIIIETIDKVLANLQRVDQKSIASLLQKQSTVLERWKSTLN